MASSKEFVAFVLEQLQQLGEITAKPMFGEYGIYCQGKYFGVVCDNRFLVKITEGGKRFWPDCPTGYPYEGGSLMFLLEELDDRERLEQMVRITCEELPAPRPKKPPKPKKK